MKVWHIVSRERFEDFQKTGIKRSTSEYILFDEFRNAYEWMVEQMVLRLPVERPAENSFPLWVWVRSESEEQPHPVLETYCHGEKGTPLVLIELEVPDCEVLVSDFSLWHHPLNEWLIGNGTDDEIDEFFAARARGLTDDERGAMRKSWELIFDLDFFEPELTDLPEEKRLQGCVWELRWDQVRSVTHFLSADPDASWDEEDIDDV